MRRFVYKIENTTKNPSIYGGRKQQATVFQIKNGELVLLGKTRVWNTASYRGNDSEVNEYLLENKFIPKMWSTIDGDWCEKHKCKNGYYTPYYFKNNKYEIKEF